MAFECNYRGRYPVTGWDIYSLAIPHVTALPSALSLASKHFVCLLSWQTSDVPTDSISSVANALLSHGCVYFCCSGPDSERVHDIIDEVIVGDGSSNVAWLDVMTTWHSKETLNETMDFFLDRACPDNRYLETCSSALILVIGENYEIRGVEAELALVSRLLQTPPDPPSRAAARKRLPK